MIYRLTHLNPDTNLSDYPIRHLEIQADTPEDACRIAIVAMTGIPIDQFRGLGVIQTILDNLWIETAIRHKFPTWKPQIGQNQWTKKHAPSIISINDIMD